MLDSIQIYIIPFIILFDVSVQHSSKLFKLATKPWYSQKPCSCVHGLGNLMCVCVCVLERERERERENYTLTPASFQTKFIGGEFTYCKPNAFFFLMHCFCTLQFTKHAILLYHTAYTSKKTKIQSEIYSYRITHSFTDTLELTNMPAWTLVPITNFS